MGNSQSKAVHTDEVNLHHFKLQRIVGKGSFGTVRIVQHRDSGVKFALKYIRKDEIVHSGSVKNIIRERQMLEHLNHPFLCNLRFCFQDVQYLYLVVDLMSGGDLRFHITRKTFTEECVRFWMAEVASALRYIHGQGIVHRDVKPENVLLDAEGHVHLADFNVATDFSADNLLTSRSGTMSYLAPEVIRGVEYASEVDWWSLGVSFYECIYGRRPFQGKTTDDLIKQILFGKIEYQLTNPPVSVGCKNAISGLLQRDTSIRIGAASWDSFITEPFFDELNFVRLEAKEISPIFVPASDDPNFDAMYDLEEFLMEETPLEARTKKQKPRPELRRNATDQEKREDDLHKIIESMFEPFDYITASYERKASVALAEHADSLRRLPDDGLSSTVEDTNGVEQPSAPSNVVNTDTDVFPPLSDVTDTTPMETTLTHARAQSVGFQPNGHRLDARSNKSRETTIVPNRLDSQSALADGSMSPATGSSNDKSKGRNSGNILGVLRSQKGSVGGGSRARGAGVLGKAGARQLVKQG